MTSSSLKTELQLIQGGGQPPPARGWFLVNTNSGQERLAKYHLDRQGFGTYLPMRATKSKRVDAGKAVPLFASYLFVRVELENPAWALIRTTMGVHSLVKVAGSLARVSDLFVDRLRSREFLGLVSLEEAKPKAQPSGYRRGDRLKITEGDFAGFDAVFERDLTDQARVMVLLSFCGREVKLQAPTSQVKAAG